MGKRGVRAGVGGGQGAPGEEELFHESRWMLSPPVCRLVLSSGLCELVDLWEQREVRLSRGQVVRLGVARRGAAGTSAQSDRRLCQPPLNRSKSCEFVQRPFGPPPFVPGSRE